MTKQQELDIIKETAEKLGGNSYCGPWLRHMLPLIEQDMRNDFPIDVPNLLKLRAEMNLLSREIEKARAKANETIADMIDKARKQVNDYKMGARERIQLELKRISEKVNFELM